MLRCGKCSPLFTGVAGGGPEQDLLGETLWSGKDGVNNFTQKLSLYSVCQGTSVEINHSGYMYPLN